MDANKSISCPAKTATSTQANAIATATLSSPTQASPSPGVNLRWYIDGFSFSSDGTGTPVAVAATIKDGSTVLHTVNFPVGAAGYAVHVVLTHPWRCSPGNAAVATLPATGGNATATIWAHVDD
jgi:hypothetical protein